MTRKEASIQLSRYFGRYPKVVEINYFIATDRVKKLEYFTEEEQELYNPSPTALRKAYDFISALLYIGSCKDRVRERLDKAKNRVAKEAKAQAELEQWRAKELDRQAKRKIYIKGKGTRLGDEALKRQTAIDNKRRIKDVLEYHARTDISIPEEMWGVIAKYK